MDEITTNRDKLYSLQKEEVEQQRQAAQQITDLAAWWPRLDVPMRPLHYGFTSKDNMSGVYIIGYHWYYLTDDPMFLPFGKVVYIGESTNLEARLRGYAIGNESHRPPVHQVVQLHMQRVYDFIRKSRHAPTGLSELFKDREIRRALRYPTLSPEDQRTMRASWMRSSGLGYRVAFTQDKSYASQLQNHVIRCYDRAGIQLWNNIKYGDGWTFPPPKRRLEVEDRLWKLH